MNSLNITNLNSKYISALYLISSPIGNIQDITFRAIEILELSDYIYCENPIITLKLLNHYRIKKKLFKYFDHSNENVRNKILNHLNDGKIVSYISDCGTPTISDPGYKLVNFIRRNNHNVFSIPGPCSAISALSVSGLATDKFYFFGFTARTEGKRLEDLKKAKNIYGSIIFFESPQRIIKFLNDAKLIFQENDFVIIKEVTKKFEKYRKFNFANFDSAQLDFEIKGEFIIIIENKTQENSNLDDVKKFLNIAQSEISNKSAVNLAKKLFQLPKKDIYKMVLDKNHE
ncbi:MAG: 16S rRNA (cytidine(1402)-2'-O)-methyltransferase [Rickettsiales bacterium]|nr:16S rRNA (cytidine(1402)-2'-O)-methyltransferase [Rickettsiales bacterium]